MKLYVGNLPWSIDDNALKELFTSYGDVEEAVLIKDKFSGRSKGFGFVTLSDDASAQKAIAEMHEKEIDHYSDGENTGDCDDEDYDTSMWFQ